MDAPEWATIVSTIVAVLGLCLAAYQTWVARTVRRTADVQISELTGLVMLGLVQVRALADANDTIVQRAKSGASVDELLSLARIARAEAANLAKHLSREIGRREKWKAGASITSEKPHL